MHLDVPASPLRIVRNDPATFDPFRRINEAWRAEFDICATQDPPPDPARIAAGGGTVLAAMEGATVAGVCAMVRRPGEWELVGMGVDPSMRNRGTGARLLAEAMGVVADAGGGRVMLRTSGLLAAAIRMYGRHGFTVSGDAPHEGSACQHVMACVVEASGQHAALE